MLEELGRSIMLCIHFNLRWKVAVPKICQAWRQNELYRDQRGQVTTRAENLPARSTAKVPPPINGAARLPDLRARRVRARMS